MSEESAPAKPPRRRKFLVVVDGTPESEVALVYASLRARRTQGGVTLVTVLQPGDFQHWLGVENIMKEEAREEAESILHRLAARVNEIAGVTPELIIRDGKTADEIKQLISEDRDIGVLVLGSGTGKEGPGPLVSLVAGGGEKSFAIPVTIVPGNLTQADLEALT